MPSPKVFDSPPDVHISSTQHVYEEIQAKDRPQKRSADILDTPPIGPQKKPRKNAHKGVNHLPNPPRERERYEKLRADKLCHILSEHSVRCKRCLGKIQLSKKNNYDEEHWKKHRRRCVRQPDWKVAESRAKNSRLLGRMSSTPELTADSASETSWISSIKSEPFDSPAPTTPPPDPAPWLNPATGPKLYADYMARAHPDLEPFYPKYPQLVDEMRAWDPTRVRFPVCFVEGAVDPMKLCLRAADWTEDSDSSDDDWPNHGSHPDPPHNPQAEPSCSS
ncbi:hypothetical protein BN946_scf184746.g35 [Trametes cinnabarina]|uniref:Uncharacterized protein n=1 Tax=Pycnoporus cinnabarinus TaxID=5643 RepID=A0A060SAQ7_PYCCI|nr:hypothetical protein BN946_scf184746.g35 [Trametes cinnabarina]